MEGYTLRQAEVPSPGPAWPVYDRAFSIIAQAIYPSEQIDDPELLEKLEAMGATPGFQSPITVVKRVVLEKLGEEALNVLPKLTPKKEELFQRHRILGSKLRD